MAAWPTLPPAVRAGMLAMADASAPPPAPTAAPFADLLAACRSLEPHAGGRVYLRDLRPRLGGDRAGQDAAILGAERAGLLVVDPFDDPLDRNRTPDVLAAGIPPLATRFPGTDDRPRCFLRLR